MTAVNWRKIFGGNGHNGKPGFLARLARDRRGNTLAIMAAALIPMVGMVGSAVDISRAYLVRVRLQQACDAGVLAARRTMTGSTLDTASRTQATNFFNINLKNGAYGATVTSITVSDVTDANGATTGAVHGTASADVPTTLMKIFGKTKISMAVTCESELQVSNNDVMFVLDTTGSMNCSAADTDSTCADNGLVEKSNARIKALRTAVVDFYDTLAAATTSDARLRIGFVPYSISANVGGVLPQAYLASAWTYQSRVAVFNTATNVAGTPSVVTTVETYGSLLPSGSCNTYGANKSYPTNDGASFSTGTPPANVVQTNYAFKDWGATGTTTGTNRTCRRTKTVTTTPYTVRYAFTNWAYQPVSYDTSVFKAGTAVPIVKQTTNPPGTVAAPTTFNEAQLATAGLGLATSSTTWSGCIEERDTVPNATFSTIPSNAYDLQIDQLPDASVATQWRPQWTDIVWGNFGSYVRINTQNANLWACSKAAQKLAVMTHQQVYDYVNAPDFKAVGYTYHDSGMLWGGRLLSPTGIFAAENATAPNGEPVNRNIVFMTDGDMHPYQYTYAMYGHETLDRRISGSTSPTDQNLMDRHNSRFLAICQALKDKNITIWVVAYAQTMTTELSTCASPGKSYYASDDATLQAAFQQIARQIAELRLSK